MISLLTGPWQGEYEKWLNGRALGLLPLVRSSTEGAMEGGGMVGGRYGREEVW